MSDLSNKYCTFFVDGSFFGVEVSSVQEVIRQQEMTRVPRAPSFIRGLINLRGQIVTAIDLRRRLGLRERDENQPPMNVVIRTNDGAVSLLVDEIDEVVDVEPNSSEQPPENVAPETRELISSVHKFPDRLMLVLDTDAVLGVSASVSGEFSDE